MAGSHLNSSTNSVVYVANHMTSLSLNFSMGKNQRVVVINEIYHSVNTNNEGRVK